MTEEERALRQSIANEIEAKLRPLTNVQKSKDGYDCCGCSTYDWIVDDAIAVALGTYVKQTDR